MPQSFAFQLVQLSVFAECSELMVLRRLTWKKQQQIEAIGVPTRSSVFDCAAHLWWHIVVIIVRGIVHQLRSTSRTAMAFKAAYFDRVL